MKFLDFLSAPFKFLGHAAEELIHLPASIVHDITSIPKALVHDLSEIPKALIHEGARVIKTGQAMISSVAGSADHALVGVTHEAGGALQGISKNLSMPLLIGGAAALLFMLKK